MNNTAHTPRTAGLIGAATDGLTLVARIGAGVAFAILIAAVTLQVVGRTAGSSPVWTEELTRFALLYLAAFGAGVALRTGELVNVDLLLNLLPARVAFALRLFTAAAIVVFAGLLIEPAWRYTAIGAFQTSPAMGLRMNIVHASVLVMLALLGVFALLRVLSMLFAGDRGTAVNDDEAN